MECSEALERLRSRAPAMRAMGATSLYVYGSTARGCPTPDSDLDLFIDYDAGGRFNAFHLIGIKQFLEQELGLPVDLTTRDGLHPRLREQIEISAIKVF